MGTVIKLETVKEKKVLAAIKKAEVIDLTGIVDIMKKCPTVKKVVDGAVAGVIPRGEAEDLLKGEPV